MTYSIQTWVDAPSTASPINATRLNVMEAGIQEANLLTSDQLTSGEELFDRKLTFSSAGATLATGTLRLVYFTARKTETIVSVSSFTGGTAAAATPSLAKMGIYTIDGSGNLTLGPKTTNDTALWSATGTQYTKALDVSFSKVKATRYVMAFLCVTAAAAPLLMGYTTQAAALGTIAPRMTARLTAQTDLPASITVGSLLDNTVVPFGLLLP